MILGRRNDKAADWRRGAFLSMAALGPGMVSGREIAFFYAQTGKSSWLGIVLCGGLFGLFTAATAHYAKKTGARNFPQIFKRTMGVYAGGVVWTLHVLALAIWMLIVLAAMGRCGGLMTAVKHGAVIGAGLGIAGAAGLSGALKEGRLWFAAVFTAAVLAALLLFGKLPGEARSYGHIRLKLKDSAADSAALSMLHACRCASVSGSIAAGFAKEARPSALGKSAGIWACLMLGLGNGILMKQPDKLMALAEPFAAMLDEAGKAGHIFACGMMWLWALAALTGIFFSLRGFLPGE